MGKKYNKGEWSEFYVFLKVLSEGKLYSANEDLERVPDVYYYILAAIKNDIKYQRDDVKNNIVFVYEDKQYEIPIEDFMALENTVITRIKNNSGTFEIKEAEEFLPRIKATTIKEKSATKGDILLQIHDDYTGYEPILSFSIKSYLGSNPTLLNASSGTVVYYKLSEDLSDKDVLNINSITGRSKVAKRIEALEDRQIKFEFKNYESDIFLHNLRMIDYRLPEIIASIYLESYFVTGKR